MSDESKKCGNCGKELGRNLWGWCSTDCLRAIAERHAPDAVKALGLKVELNSLRAQLDAVTKERDADKARLDWLFDEAQIRRTVYTTTPLHKFATDQIICDRSDIDAAIAAEKGTK